MVSARLTAQQKALLLCQHLQDGVPLTRLAEHAGIPERTLRRWATTYRADGTVDSLERRRRSDAGQRRLPDDLIAAVEALALRRPAPTTAFVHRRIADMARDRGLAPPSYSTVRDIVTSIDPGLRTLATGGDTAYRDRFELVYRRSAARPNEQWQADHTLLDVQILDAHRRPARPWLTVVLDDYSRAVAGYTLFLGAPSAERTALALHQAVIAKGNPAWPVQGLPDVLYSDHGSDFTSSRLERVCLDTHVSLIHSRIGVPQGRGKIERLFRTITTELLPHLPGYIPHGTGGQPTTPPQLTLAELDSAVERFVVEEYHSRPHSETRQPPVVRWLADGWIPRSPAHPEDLDTLLLTAATSRIVQRDGIRFSGTRYISPVLAAYVGESVTIRYDPRDAAEVHVYYCDKYLCRAIAPELAREAVTLEQLQDARVARRRALKKELRERRSLADALPADHHYAVVQPAGLPGVDGQRPPAEPPVPRHRLRTYAND
ncbi:Mu transposase C-terminal domain-containing protein [Miniimonas sp. S16]|uniref:Mu transposase C-terminal domain-containing protein n=1 Tax=Miniimonas sp. S16 TaxID=2171623 RepID=UPI000D525A4B|nr:Mu transposase C-terminal domain-containing protein [Miniimonas sp. S16]